MKHLAYISLLVLTTCALLTMLGGCKGDKSQEAQEENKEAKRMLQGAWVNADNETLTMNVKGDTIYYADSTSVPTYFAVIKDSLVLRGSKEQHLAIVKQTNNLFQFKNPAGDVITLHKAEDPTIAEDIPEKVVCTLNQNELIKRDTIITGAETNYHVYTQVNPTTYRVLHSVINNDGVSVDNAYYDNIVHVGIFIGARKIYGANFHKQDFAKLIPEEYLKGGILSDIIPVSADEDGVHLSAFICIPDSPAAYTVSITINKDGKMVQQ